LINPTEYETERERDGNIESHHQYQSHRHLPFETNGARLPEQGYRTVFTRDDFGKSRDDKTGAQFLNSQGRRIAANIEPPDWRKESRAADRGEYRAAGLAEGFAAIKFYQPTRVGLTPSTAAPGQAAASAAAAAAAASPAASTTTAAASATSAPPPLSDFLAELRLCGIFLVEDVERRQADVRDFLVAKKEFMRL
jgi:hypothetical protein